MIKVNAEKIICASELVIELLKLGITPASHYCYEKGDEGGWEFAGEYVGQDDVIPAWTLEELQIYMGGEFAKPDLLSKAEWTRSTVNMLQYRTFFPDKMKTYPNGANAAADCLQYMLSNDIITVAEANERMEHFIKGKNYNPLDPEKKKKK